eukprot:12213344-Heterocapsa_arctica.AAC.1
MGGSRCTSTAVELPALEGATAGPDALVRHALWQDAHPSRGHRVLGEAGEGTTKRHWRDQVGHG